MQAKRIAFGLIAGSLVLGLVSPSFAQSMSGPASGTVHHRKVLRKVHKSTAHPRRHAGPKTFEAGARSRGPGDVGAGGAPGARGFGSGSGDQ
jgi:hypothetical protein